MSKRRVVVTGLGMLSPVGNTVESTSKALLAGQSGISLIDHFDTSAYATKFAGLVKDFNCEDIISRKEQRKMDAFIQYGIVAGVQAMQDSGLEITEENRNPHWCRNWLRDWRPRTDRRKPHISDERWST